MELGYALSSEEHTPNTLIRHAQRAEAIGFTFAPSRITSTRGWGDRARARLCGV